MPKYDFPNKRDAPEDHSDIYTPSTTFDERSDIYTPSSESLAIVNGAHAHGSPPRFAHAAVAAFPVTSSSLPPTLPNGQVINAKNTLRNNGDDTSDSNRNKGFHNDYLHNEQPIVEAQVLSSSFVDHGPYGVVASGGPTAHPAAAADIVAEVGGYEHGDPEMPAATTTSTTAATDAHADAAEEAFAPNKAASDGSSNENANRNQKIKAAVGAAGTTLLVIILVIIFKAVLQGASDGGNTNSVPRPSPPVRNWAPSFLGGGSTRSPLPPHWSSLDFSSSTSPSPSRPSSLATPPPTATTESTPALFDTPTAPMPTTRLTWSPFQPMSVEFNPTSDLNSTSSSTSPSPSLSPAFRDPFV